ncbi:polysaccharide deacetylase family protein [Butyrivibrio sp. MC2021]|uniref:polysaccharide deacetylase family protein n=1 Tax=Butyrivibrio sp. MC2021 TaxID=1408306 RepID=UPI00055BED1D|nr:polysaccharide deacetylase family protein [Butyrivibrio sp. MC2021]
MGDKLRNIYTQFPGGKYKVLTLSYDDGKIEDRRLVEILNRYGLKATFNVNSGLIDQHFKEYYKERIPMSEYKELYKGHEVAVHTVTHPTIARSPKEQMVRQIIEDRSALEKVMGYTVRGSAYPNGSYSDEVVDALKACGIRYARTVRSTGDFSMPEHYLRWHPTCHHDYQGLEDLKKQFVSLSKSQYMYMFYLWGHSYEFEVNNNWNVIEDFAKDMGGRGDIWYATNIEIVDYLDAAGRMQVSVNGDFAYNPSAVSVFLEVDKKTIECKPGVTTEL